MDELARLQRWYRTQCDGDWEHSFGVEIETLDNPGWHVTVDIDGTELADREFLPVVRTVELDQDDWVHCKVESAQFIGSGGPGNLAEILAAFLTWAERDG